MSRRRRQGLSPTLFPFLAVLVCTLGTLILLLALVAQNATQAAEQQTQQQEAEAKAASSAGVVGPKRPTIEQVERRIREEAFRVQELVAHREKQTAAIEERRSRLTHLEDHIRRIQDELQQLNEEVETATADTTVEAPEEQEILLLKEKLEAERAALERIAGEHDSQEPRIVIVPHKGPNGTDRRPVYLECTAEGLTIWPEGSKIAVGQIGNTSIHANPVDAALRVIRHYVVQVYRDPIAPYPLLVVRPDGIDTYAAVRRAMSDWDDQFGYELVAAEAKLAFPDPDPQLKRRIDRAIRDAVVKQHAQQAIAARSNFQRRSGSLPTLSAAELDRRARSYGYRQSQPNLRGRAEQLNAGRHGASRGSNAGSQLSNSPTANPYLGSGLAGQPGLSGAEVARQLEQHLQDAAGKMGGVSDSDSDSASQSGGVASGNGQSESAAEYEQLERSGALELHGAGGGLAGQPPAQGNASQQTSDASDAASQQSSAQAADGDSATQWADVGRYSPGSSASGGTAASGSSQPMPTNQPQGGASGSMPMGGAQMPADSDRQESFSGEANRADANSEDSQKELVRRAGRNWALPRHLAGQNGTAIVRTIRVLCYPDRFVLMPATSKDATEVFGLSNGDVNRATLELATAVRDRVARWGAPLPGGRWQPRLDVQVRPHADTRFHQLRTLLNGSGVEVREVPTTPGASQ